MGYGALRGAAVAVRPSEAESQRFGLEVVRVEVGSEWTPVDPRRPADELLVAIARTNWDLAIVRLPAIRRELVRALVEQEYRVVPGDTLMYWGCDVGRVSSRAGHDSRVRRAGASDLPLLDRMVASSFSDYRNHYASNPLLDAQATREGYRDWAQKSVRSGGLAFIVEDSEGAGGFATVMSDASGSWEIELAGMEPAAAGRGLYRLLLEQILMHAADHDIPRLLISTQAHNIRVQRVWARAGLVPLDAFDTLHLIRNPAA